MLRWTITALAALSGACTDAPSAMDASVPEADGYALIALELGTGRESFEPVAPFGQHVPLIHGPQGGYHIYGRYRFNGFAPDVYVTFRVTPVEGGAPVNDPANRVHRMAPQALVRGPGGWEDSFAELVIFTAIHGPAEVAGRTFRWQVFVQNAATGQVATAEREVVVDAPM